jgi:hypothetical protein
MICGSSTLGVRRRSLAIARDVARLLIIAILLQTWLAAPAALRMAAAMAPDETAAGALCRAAAAGSVDDDKQGSAPSPAHRHDGCSLCIGGIGPFLAEPARGLAATDTPSSPTPTARDTGRAPHPLAHAYASRAPPPAQTRLFS